MILHLIIMFLYLECTFVVQLSRCNNILDMTCLVQIFIYTTVNSKITKINKIHYLPTLKLKNKSETELIFSRPYHVVSELSLA